MCYHCLSLLPNKNCASRAPHPLPAGPVRTHFSSSGFSFTSPQIQLGYTLRCAEEGPVSELRRASQWEVAEESEKC